MAIFNWITRPRGQTASGSPETREDTNPKFLEPSVAHLPPSPYNEPRPSDLSSSMGTEKELEMEKIPQEYGRLASWRGSLILLVTSGSQFLDNVFMTSSNMALASIQDEFKVSNTNLQWMISAYTLSFGGFLLLAGALSDRYVSTYANTNTKLGLTIADMDERKFSVWVFSGYPYGPWLLALANRLFNSPCSVASKVSAQP